MGYTLHDGTIICLGRCLCAALGVGKNEQGCAYLDEDVKHTHCCFVLDLSVLLPRSDLVWGLWITGRYGDI